MCPQFEIGITDLPKIGEGGTCIIVTQYSLILNIAESIVVCLNVTLLFYYYWPFGPALAAS